MMQQRDAGESAWRRPAAVPVSHLSPLENVRTRTEHRHDQHGKPDVAEGGDWKRCRRRACGSSGESTGRLRIGICTRRKLSGQVLQNVCFPAWVGKGGVEFAPEEPRLATVLGKSPAKATELFT